MIMMMRTHSRRIISVQLSDARILRLRLSELRLLMRREDDDDNADSLDDEGGWQVVPEVGDELPAAPRAVGHLQLLEAAELDQVGEAARGQRGAA